MTAREAFTSCTDVLMAKRRGEGGGPGATAAALESPSYGVDVEGD
jgi:hypothetical protein